MPHVYHLDLDEELVQGARHAFVPGDPGRVPAIAEAIAEAFGGEPEEIARKREYRTFRAEIEGRPVLVTSTGIGGPSASIAVDELAQLGVRTFLRIGTTGAIGDGLGVGDVVITTGSVRFDGASRDYAPIEFPAVAHHEVVRALAEAAREEDVSFQVGVTASTDTFYPGQERTDSYSGHVPRHFAGRTEELRRLHVLNYEMESATLLTMCAAQGLRAGCVTGVVAHRSEGEHVQPGDLTTGEANAIQVGVAAMGRLVRE